VSPLVGIGACVSIQFGVLEYTKRYFSAYNARTGQDASQSAGLSSSQLLIAGSLAGLGNGFVSGPVEHIRIRASLHRSSRHIYLRRAGLQTQSNTNPEYRGPLDAIKKISSKYGIRGIYKGQNVTLLREAVGYGVYFWAYEKLVQREMALSGIRREQISPSSAVLYGAAAGYVVSDRSRHMKAQVADCGALSALGCDLPHRYDQVTDANGRVFPI